MTVTFEASLLGQDFSDDEPPKDVCARVYHKLELPDDTPEAQVQARLEMWALEKLELGWWVE